MTSVCLSIEDFSWNRITFDAEAENVGGIKLHNHAFIHTPECVRTCSVTLNRNGLKVFFFFLAIEGIFNLSFTKSFMFR